MTESRKTQERSVQAIVDLEMRRDRLVGRVSVAAWAVTFLVLIGFGIVIGHEASRTLTLAREGMVTQQAVLESLVPLFVVVGVTSLLLALVSTAAVFLRQRTASLADIQLRLATLEAIVVNQAEDAGQS
jgi:hypothetical protein